MIEVVALGGLVAIVALALRAKVAEAEARPKAYLDERSPKLQPKGLSEDVKKVIIRHAKGENPPTKTELQLAASSASMAGFDKLGDELYKQAESAPDKLKRTVMPSPIEGVSDQLWTAFVKKMGTAKLDTVTPVGIGAFQTSVRRLVDFGVLKDPRKENGTWTAEWVVSKPKLLSDPRLQYKIFERSMVSYARMIKDRYKNAITQYTTLSGLLAVAHCAGPEGLGKWIQEDPNSPERTKFKRTAALYEAVNGIF
jgi:hypothetical protein